MITVQERGNSIYRDSTYSAANLSTFGRQSFNRGLSLFGRNSFGRGTDTFKKYQKTRMVNNNSEQEQGQAQNNSSQSSSQPIELDNLQHESVDVLQQQPTTYRVEFQQLQTDDSTN